MPFDVRTDKRILERELHAKGQAFADELTRLREQAPDCADRAAPRDGDLDELRQALVEETRLRAQRILKDLEKGVARRERARGEED
jgi:hypothetical protein